MDSKWGRTPALALWHGGLTPSDAVPPLEEGEPAVSNLPFTRYSPTVRSRWFRSPRARSL